MNNSEQVTFSTTDIRRKEDLMRYSQNEKDMKNFECYEQAILLAILNPFCGFKLQKPFKQSITITSRPEVVCLYFDYEEIEIRRLAEQQCELFALQSTTQNVSEKTRMRRFSKNRSTFTLNFLYDICLEYGFFFNSVLSKKSKKCFQVERIHQIFYYNKLWYGYDEIVFLGQKLNSYLFSLVRDQKDIVVPRGDPYIQKLALTNFCLCPTLSK
ncbi:hypothetical protein EHI8A_008410 [Entamoeba histolytica HM-1:IMSS-B]|uniref:Uncharacterized protein n=7 Tax=Entamoeba TaxID=5758 RepID=C4LZY1_ENTH1|nr:hypothetical protein EHI_065650 [Entamoeba histolytica HM-1:IMSS]EMD47044.1 Hypothetical protein EHI5A_025660 [Entamoeba histolytica KU27]EMH74945.1 hypothetical protein EHI8A_008410 [Entamoeba histolytica HM-1:IMSS-B]EMS14170.1 hypothetical protein KM1_027730 [Entamoeba histolytica HM-3:IMSS]ENY62189.1 hypothetical protein EHI7A_014640 [Entamoeba histolytica HM-1:IMSS-A]BAN39816.1 hypothetical protein [Entamoeba histolytica]|eukprot:XP_653641.1 hypothetical protein EHI_065650 [Entamoeba histolytica HM-1:IMSS]